MYTVQLLYDGQPTLYKLINQWLIMSATLLTEWDNDTQLSPAQHQLIQSFSPKANDTLSAGTPPQHHTDHDEVVHTNRHNKSGSSLLDAYIPCIAMDEPTAELTNYSTIDLCHYMYDIQYQPLKADEMNNNPLYVSLKALQVDSIHLTRCIHEVDTCIQSIDMLYKEITGVTEQLNNQCDTLIHEKHELLQQHHELQQYLVYFTYTTDIVEQLKQYEQTMKYNTTQSNPQQYNRNIQYVNVSIEYNDISIMLNKIEACIEFMSAAGTSVLQPSDQIQYTKKFHLLYSKLCKIILYYVRQLFIQNELDGKTQFQSNNNIPNPSSSNDKFDTNNMWYKTYVQSYSTAPHIHVVLDDVNSRMDKYNKHNSVFYTQYNNVIADICTMYCNYRGRYLSSHVQSIIQQYNNTANHQQFHTLFQIFQLEYNLLQLLFLQHVHDTKQHQILLQLYSSTLEYVYNYYRHCVTNINDWDVLVELCMFIRYDLLSEYQSDGGNQSLYTQLHVLCNKLIGDLQERLVYITYQRINKTLNSHQNTQWTRINDQWSSLIQLNNIQHDIDSLVIDGLHTISTLYRCFNPQTFQSVAIELIQLLCHRLLSIHQQINKLNPVYSLYYILHNLFYIRTQIMAFNINPSSGGTGSTNVLDSSFSVLSLHRKQPDNDLSIDELIRQYSQQLIMCHTNELCGDLIEFDSTRHKNPVLLKTIVMKLMNHTNMNQSIDMAQTKYYTTYKIITHCMTQLIHDQQIEAILLNSVQTHIMDCMNNIKQYVMTSTINDTEQNYIISAIDAMIHITK